MAPAGVGQQPGPRQQLGGRDRAAVAGGRVEVVTDHQHRPGRPGGPRADVPVLTGRPRPGRHSLHDHVQGRPKYRVLLLGARCRRRPCREGVGVAAVRAGDGGLPLEDVRVRLLRSRPGRAGCGGPRGRGPAAGFARLSRSAKRVAASGQAWAGVQSPRVTLTKQRVGDRAAGDRPGVCARAPRPRAAYRLAELPASAQPAGPAASHRRKNSFSVFCAPTSRAAGPRGNGLAGGAATDPRARVDDPVDDQGPDLVREQVGVGLPQHRTVGEPPVGHCPVTEAPPQEVHVAGGVGGGHVSQDGAARGGRTRPRAW